MPDSELIEPCRPLVAAVAEVGLCACMRVCPVCLQDCVALTLKQPAVIGLNGQELRERLQGLADAVGCDRAGAVRLAAASSTLIMLHPSYIKVCGVLLLQHQHGEHCSPVRVGTGVIVGAHGSMGGSRVIVWHALCHGCANSALATCNANVEGRGMSWQVLSP